MKINCEIHYGSFKSTMHLLRLISLSFIICLTSFSINAQYSVGVGLVGATSTGMNFKTNKEIVSPGIQAKLQYRIKEFMAISPNVTFFRDSKMDNFSYSYFETSLDIQWNLINIEQNRGYLILGPTYNRTDFALPASVNGTDAIIEGGLNRYGGNLGVGIEQKTNFYQEFLVQYKSKLKGSSFREIQLLLKIGYLFNMGKPKSEFRKSSEVLTNKL